VTIEASGDAVALDAFAAGLAAEAPPAARVAGSRSSSGRRRPDAAPGFVIVESEGAAADGTTAISPDLPVCDDCLREMRDPADRRFGYAFVNCTNCGPALLDHRGAPLRPAADHHARLRHVRRLRARVPRPRRPPLPRPADRLPALRAAAAVPAVAGRAAPPGRRAKAAAPGTAAAVPGAATPVPGTATPCAPRSTPCAAGRIVAIKGLGGYHLACDARDAAAVAALRERKFRKEKPFAVMARDLDALEGVVELDDAARDLLLSSARPIVLLPEGRARASRRVGARQRRPRRHAALHAAAPPALRRRGAPAAGHDERQPLLGADRLPRRRCPRRASLRSPTPS
jgi:hydrogenase maturation protein HypF